MADSIFCPVCDHKNNADAARCVHCATPLAANDLVERSTLRVPDKLTVVPQKSTRCADYAPNLPKGALILFVMDEPEPIIIQDTQSITIGRRAEGSATPSVDLAAFGAAVLGVSRHHIRIRNADGTWTVEDLESTNGTWLNRVRLSPHKSHELQDNDIVWLGHLKLSVCFGASQPVREAFLTLKDIAAATPSPQRLTPLYLAAYIIPYLEAVAEIERICNEVRGAISEEMHVNNIGAKDDLIFVRLDGVSESVELIQRHLIPWRKQLYEGRDEPELNLDAARQDELAELARRVVADMAPGVPDEELSAYLEMFLPPFSLLATTPLELR